MSDSFQCKATLAIDGAKYTIHRLDAVYKKYPQAQRLPFSLKILLENLLRTEDGALIVMTYRGVRHASSEVNDRIARGEHVPPSEYYLRTAPFFETASTAYAWLNTIVSVGIGDRRPTSVVYDVFEVL